jgi:hypothetical protein
MRAFLTVLIMMTLAPVAAVTTLVCWNPGRWGGSINPLAILGMSFFGIFTIPLWPTYLPAIVLTPFIMRRLAAQEAFRRLPLLAVMGISLVIGALAGAGIISIIVPWRDTLDLILNWVSAGAVSGAVTLPLISLIYRKIQDGAERGAALNGDPVMPPLIPKATGGPQAVN